MIRIVKMVQRTCGIIIEHFKIVCIYFFYRISKYALFYRKFVVQSSAFLVDIMVLISDGNSEIGAHVRINL